MIAGLCYVLLEVEIQLRRAQAEKARMEEDMRRHIEECEEFDRALYGRDAIDVEARFIEDAPLLAAPTPQP